MSNPSTIRPPVRLGICALIIAIGASTTDASTQTLYTVTDLGFLAGDASSRPHAINAFGDVAGTSSASLSHHPFVWTDAQGLTALPMPTSASWAFGRGINDRGEVAVQASFGTCSGIPGHAFRWNPLTGYADLGALAGGSADPTWINNHGTVVGAADTSPCSYVAFVTTSTGMTSITLGAAAAVNDGGQITGTNGQGAFRFDPGAGVTALGALAGLPISRGQAIDAAGRVTGVSKTNNGHVAHMFLHTPGVGMQDLGWVGKRTQVRSMSPGGHAVGQWDNDNGTEYGFVWDASAGLVDLNTMLVDPTWVILDAFAINDRGQIAAFGFQGFGSSRALRLDPIVTGTPARSVPVGAGCGSAPTTLTAGPPVLGAPLNFDSSQAQAAAPLLLALAVGGAVASPWHGNCTIYVDLQNGPASSFGFADPLGAHRWTLNLPADPQLAGTPFAAQVAVLTGSIELSNGLDLLLGN